MKTFPIPTILILLIAMLWVAPETSLAGMREAPKAPWLVTYHDGSGNGYRFWKDSEGEDARFEYSPVQPKESSTGMYSGGEPAKGVLSSKQVRELWERILRLESDATLREEARAKGTGTFGLKDPSGNREFIIKACPQLLAWNQFLSIFRRGEQGLISPPK